MIQPGKTVTQSFSIANNGSSDLVLKALVVPFKAKGELGKISLEEESPTTNWFSLQNADIALGEKFSLPAGKTQQIVLKIKVPQHAKENDYYLTLLFETIPDQFLGESGSKTQAKIGSNILLTVSETGEPPKKAEIEEFKILDSLTVWGLQFIDSFDQPEFLVRVKNTGRTYFKPIGKISLTTWFGQRYVLNLLPENVLANSIRQIKCLTSKETTPSACRLSPGFLVGPQKAQLVFGLDKESEDYRANFLFYAIPFKLILGLLTTTLLLTIIIMT
jgi:hypothetical protein